MYTLLPYNMHMHTCTCACACACSAGADNAQGAVAALLVDNGGTDDWKQARGRRRDGQCQERHKDTHQDSHTDTSHDLADEGPT